MKIIKIMKTYTNIETLAQRELNKIDNGSMTYEEKENQLEKLLYAFNLQDDDAKDTLEERAKDYVDDNESTIIDFYDYEM